MAAGKVVVKKLSAIENFSSMNILCTDKTGTLTTGTIKIAGSYDAAGIYSCCGICKKGFLPVHL